MVVPLLVADRRLVPGASFCDRGADLVPAGSSNSGCAQAHQRLGGPPYRRGQDRRLDNARVVLIRLRLNVQRSTLKDGPHTFGRFTPYYCLSNGSRSVGRWRSLVLGLK